MSFVHVLDPVQKYARANLNVTSSFVWDCTLKYSRVECQNVDIVSTARETFQCSNQYITTLNFVANKMLIVQNYPKFAKMIAASPMMVTILSGIDAENKQL